MQKSGKHRIFQFLTTSNNPLIYNPLQRFGCHQSVKDKNFESNSQLGASFFPLRLGCHQSVKDKNFESNSQHIFISLILNEVVISLSKIKISKAIHNRYIAQMALYTLSSVCQR